MDQQDLSGSVKAQFQYPLQLTLYKVPCIMNLKEKISTLRKRFQVCSELGAFYLAFDFEPVQY